MIENKPSSHYLALADEISKKRNKSKKFDNKKLKEFADYSTFTVIGLTLTTLVFMIIARNK